MTITLHALSLWSKSGFGDGDMLTDPIWDLGFEAFEKIDEFDDDGVTWTRSLDELVLEHLVTTRLLPACPEPVETMFIGTCHNPVRALRWYEAPPQWVAEIEVIITEDELRAAIEHVRAAPKDAP